MARAWAEPSRRPQSAGAYRLDGYKSRKDSWVRMPVSTPGQQPTLRVTPTEEQVRTKRTRAMRRERAGDRESAELIYADQAYIGEGRGAG